MRNEIRQPPNGIIAALATPLDDDERVDEKSLGKLTRHVIDGGVSGVLALGATGEGPALSARERQGMIELTVQQVDRRVPVICGVCEVGTNSAIEFVRSVARAGADAVLVAAPYFFGHSAASIIDDYFRAVADASDVPIWIYNSPANVHTMLSPGMIAGLSQHPNVVAIKDSTGDFTHFQDLVARFNIENNFAVYQGVGYHLAASFRLGVRGGIVGLANVMPRFFVALYEAARAGQNDRVDQLQAALLEYRHVTAAAPHLSIPLTKSALETLGLCSGRATRPFGAVDAQTRQAMQNFVDRCTRLCETETSTRLI